MHWSSKRCLSETKLNTKRQENIRNKDKHTKLLCKIEYSNWNKMFDNLLTDEEMGG